jgi:hypothetical protein
MRDWYYDPPEEEEVPYAVKCTRCGRFVKFVRTDHVSFKDWDGSHDGYDVNIYHCTCCGEIDKVKGVYA